MMTNPFTRLARAGRAWPSYPGVLALAALFLSVPGLLAGPVVTTISGGPSQSNPSYFGYVDGSTISNAQFHTPIGLAQDGTGGLLYVADRDNNAVRQLNLAGGITITFATSGISKPVGVVLDGENNVYVLNRGNGNNGTVLKFDPFGYFLGTNAFGLVNANGVTIDLQTNLYVTYGGNKVLQIAADGTQPMQAPRCRESP
jgi:DNA-binding beta-propeller fold protein YncE